MEHATTSELLEIPGMDAKRVDMILGGAVLFEECLEAVGTQKFQTTEASLRDGLLEEAIQLVREDGNSQIGFHLEDFYAKAERLGAQEIHFRQVQKLSETLFDRLTRAHHLDSRWRPYLSAAAILHDVGEAISPSEHEKHSYYVIRNAHFSSLDPWEVDFVARLCLFHRSGKPNGKDLGEITKDCPGHLARERKDAFLKLLALLRVADALDRGHKGHLQLKSVRVTEDEIRIYAQFKGPSELEFLRIEQKKSLFEEVFERRLRLVRT
jgi:exopolyphosphatase/guanosine-5'-triphosphate,3'-diphosphate pyrophosphatase